MKDTRIEVWLQSKGIAWTYEEDIDIKTILVTEAIKKNIRLSGKLHEEIVQSYMEAQRNGARFPAIVLVKVGNQFQVINGVHRLEMYTRLNIPTTDAYVVQTQDAITIDVLRRTVNTIEGIRPSEEESILQAIYLVDLHKYTAKDAARAMNLPYGQVKNAIITRRTILRLEKQEVNVEKLGFSNTTIFYLGAIERDNHLKKVTLLAHEARLSVQDIRQLIQEVKDAASDEEADVRIEEWATRYRDEITRSQRGLLRPPSSPLRRLPSIMKQATRIMSQAATAHTLKSDERKTLIAQARQTAKALLSFAKNLEDIEKHETNEPPQFKNSYTSDASAMHAE